MYFVWKRLFARESAVSSETSLVYSARFQYNRQLSIKNNHTIDCKNQSKRIYVIFCSYACWYCDQTSRNSLDLRLRPHNLIRNISYQVKWQSLFIVLDLFVNATELDCCLFHAVWKKIIFRSLKLQNIYIWKRILHTRAHGYMYVCMKIWIFIRMYENRI